MVPEGPQIDPYEVLRAVGVTDARAAEPLAGGWDTSIWRVERRGEPAVLRLLRATEADRCRREVAAMEAASAAGVPAPAVLAEGEWEGRPALLLSWCPGTPLAHALRAEPDRAAALGLAFGATLARLHAVRAPEMMPHIGVEWIGAVGPGEEALQASLREVTLNAKVLLHLDYHPMNTLTDGETITGLVDWANAAAGDPRADLARALVLLDLIARIHAATAALRSAVRVLRVAFLRGYRDAGGCTERMALFLAWGWAVTARDLSPNLDRPGHWLRPEHLEFMRCRAAAWKRRAGLPSAE
jgi:aminoglycoside phosphotransferase (APT) family kinase protein